MLKRNPSFLIMNSYLPSFFTMVMTIASLFLNEQMHFSTTIMLVLTSQLCLYTLFQSSLEGIPRTAYMKLIDYWNMFAMTVSLTNFFTLFLWELLQFRGIHKQLKITTRIVISLITLFGVITYWVIAGLLYFEYIKQQISKVEEVRFARLLSGGFTTMAVINPPERKLAKRTSVHCLTSNFLTHMFRTFLWIFKVSSLL